MEIKKLNKAEVLAALYNNAKVQGMGILQADDKVMTTEDAAKILESGQTYFDYLKGRVMKVDINELDFRLYNRDNGEGAAENAIKELKEI